jgi:dipeptidyl aminopeptidase/acylaminoacyl peptidase
MKYMKLFLSVSLAFGLSGVAHGKITAANGYNAGTPVPLDYWAVRSAVNGVSISPDGKHMAVQRITSKDGDPIIEIFQVNNLAAAPIRLNAKPMEFLGSPTWVSDDVFFGQAMQVIGKSVKGPERDVRRYQNFSYNIKTKKFSTFSTPTGAGVFELANVLPKEPRKILIGTSNGPSAAASDDPFAAFRPRSYYRYDIDTGARSLVYRGGGKQPQASFDINGKPRLSSGIDAASDEIITYYRSPTDTDWKEIMRLEARDFDRTDFAYVSDVKGKPDVILVRARANGEDKIALWEFNTNTKQYGRKVYGNPEADVIGAFGGNFWAGDGEIKGVVYPGAKIERHFLDQEEKALYDKIRPNIKNAFQMSITSRSRDGNVMTVFNSSPKDSGTHYLINRGKLQKIGSSNPLLKPTDYSNVEYIKYPARDGLMIPAYVTKPKGAGPHPLVVLPHGGPYVQETIVYDEWSQMLANNGYMVIQPQYRGSEGHGWKHFISTWHQHGLAMNDDKDDGAKYLISKGLVDPDRVAMFGWSYGGYAALVAASREDQIYQCTIPAAFVADPLMSYNGRKNDTLKYFDEFSAQRGGKVGINPMNEVDKVNVPMLLIHPEWDRRVLFKHYTKYKKALKKAGKADKMKFLPIKGADHFLYTHRYEHNIEYMSAILDYLQNDCGPGGL